MFLASIVHPFNNNWNFTPLILNRQPQNRFNRTSFQQQLKHFLQSRRSCNNSASIVHPFNNNWNISAKEISDNRFASIVHPFNNNWNKKKGAKWETFRLSFNRTSFQQQLKRQYFSSSVSGFLASIVHPFNNNWNPCCFNQPAATPSLQSYILSTTTETLDDGSTKTTALSFNRTSFQQQLKQVCKSHRGKYYRLQSYILSTTTETHSKKRENSAPDQTQPNF